MSKKLIEHYKCWGCDYKEQKWYTREELVKRVEAKNHIDFVCPKCSRVIICSGEEK